MTDLEKVLSWLEGLTEDDWRMYHSDSEVQNIAKAAFELLKEQEPTKPIEPIEEMVNDVLLWHCAKCGFYLGPNDHFCSNCGRSVKWDA